MWIIGVACSLLANIASGIGQTTQKHAINRIEKKLYQAAPYTSQSLMIHRLTDKFWLLGICLHYLGELGNAIALSHISASTVAPMGLVAVLTNVFLASKYLGERVVKKQKYGYALVCFGVLLVLLSSLPGNAFGNQIKTNKFTRVSEFLKYCMNWEFAFAFLCILSALSYLIYRIVFLKKKKLVLYVGVCCLFGTCSITCTKILSTLLLLSAKDYHSSKKRSMVAHHKDLFNHSASHNFSLANSTTLDYIQSQEVFMQESLINLSDLSKSSVLLYLLIVIVICTVGQETFKQQALTIHPVSKFQSLLYAGFNALVVFTHVILFREVVGVWYWIWFILCFTFGILCILRGFQFVQSSSTNWRIR